MHLYAAINVVIERYIVVVVPLDIIKLLWGYYVQIINNKGQVPLKIICLNWNIDSEWENVSATLKSLNINDTEIEQWDKTEQLVRQWY